MTYEVQEMDESFSDWYRDLCVRFKGRITLNESASNGAKMTARLTANNNREMIIGRFDHSKGSGEIFDRRKNSFVVAVDRRGMYD